MVAYAYALRTDKVLPYNLFMLAIGGNSHRGCYRTSVMLPDGETSLLRPHHFYSWQNSRQYRKKKLV